MHDNAVCGCQRLKCGGNNCLQAGCNAQKHSEALVECASHFANMDAVFKLLRILNAVGMVLQHLPHLIIQIWQFGQLEDECGPHVMMRGSRHGASAVQGSMCFVVLASAL